MLLPSAGAAAAAVVCLCFIGERRCCCCSRCSGEACAAALARPVGTARCRDLPRCAAARGRRSIWLQKGSGCERLCAESHFKGNYLVAVLQGFMGLSGRVLMKIACGIVVCGIVWLMRKGARCLFRRVSPAHRLPVPKVKACGCRCRWPASTAAPLSLQLLTYVLWMQLWRVVILQLRSIASVSASTAIAARWGDFDDRAVLTAPLVQATKKRSSKVAVEDQQPEEEMELENVEFASEVHPARS